ncbi:MAG: hypothetical protein GX572_02020, partial [Clostridia bacterium]|nr:hypothetical protein [Clostridia bacterium]
LIVLLLLVVAGWAFFFVQNSLIIPRQIAAADAYLGNDQVAADYANVQALTAQKQAIEHTLFSLREAKANLDSYPSLDHAAYLRILGCAGGFVALQSLDFHRESGELILLAEADSATRAAWFVSRLRSSGGFSSIAYYGYAADRSSSGAYRNYVFSVNAFLPGGGGDV